MFVILPEPTLFAAFLAAATVLIISPGPDTLYVASRSLAQGRLSGLVAAMGVFAGVFVHISAAALGLAGLFAYAPLAYDVLRWVGVLYLLYLAWGALTGSDEKNASSGIALPHLSYRRIFWQAALTDVLNPKTAIFFLAFLPQFTARDHGPIWLQMAVLGLLIDLMGLCWLVTISLGIGLLGDRLRRNVVLRRVQRWILGGTLTSVAIWLAIPDRR